MNYYMSLKTAQASRPLEKAQLTPTPQNGQSPYWHVDKPLFLNLITPTEYLFFSSTRREAP